MLPVAIAAIAGLATGLIPASWASTGRYRRGQERTRLALPWAWVLAPVVGAAWSILVASRIAPAVLPAGLGWAAAGAAIAWVDLDVHRIPDRSLVLAAPLVLGAAAAGAGIAGEWGRLWTALAAAGALGFLYLLLALLGSLGIGDVKLAALTGLVLGLEGWTTVVAGTVATFVAAGIGAAALLIRHRTADRHMAFGPAILLGAFVALACA